MTTSTPTEHLLTVLYRCATPSCPTVVEYPTRCESCGGVRFQPVATHEVAAEHNYRLNMEAIRTEAASPFGKGDDAAKRFGKRDVLDDYLKGKY